MWPRFGEDEIQTVKAVLQSGKVNYWNGNEGREFEREFAEFCDVPHGVAVSNGTVALELALEALGIGPGDEVVVTPRTFLASASSILMRGARPIFADVNHVSQNISAETIEMVLTSRTRAIMTVHLAGWPCEMDGIRALADRHDLRIIEDCAQAHGAEYRGHKVGSFGDAAAFSFCTDKIMSTGGEGGMLLLQDDAAWRRAWSYKDHGKEWDAVYNRLHPPGFRWLHESFGTNWRLTEMQSAIGRVQLKKLPEWLKARRANAAVFNNAFLNVPGLRVTIPPAYVNHAYYKYYVFVEPDALKTGWERDRIIHEVNEEGVSCYSGSCSEVYLERSFENSKLRPKKRLPIARALGENSLMFPVDHTLDEYEIDDMITALLGVMSRAVK